MTGNQPILQSANFTGAGLINSASEPEFATKTAEQRIVRNLIFIISINMSNVTYPCKSKIRLLRLELYIQVFYKIIVRYGIFLIRTGQKLEFLFLESSSLWETGIIIIGQSDWRHQASFNLHPYLTWTGWVMISSKKSAAQEKIEQDQVFHLKQIALALETHRR